MSRFLGFEQPEESNKLADEANGIGPKLTLAIQIFVDSTKELIGLASAILAVLIAFASQFAAQLDSWLIVLLIVVLIGFLLSVGCGILVILGFAGILDPYSPTMQRYQKKESGHEAAVEASDAAQAAQQQIRAESPPVPSPYDLSIRPLSCLQILLFGVSLVGLVTVFALGVATSRDPQTFVRQTVEAYQLAPTVGLALTTAFAPTFTPTPTVTRTPSPTSTATRTAAPPTWTAMPTAVPSPT